MTIRGYFWHWRNMWCHPLQRVSSTCGVQPLHLLVLLEHGW
jgi:hypothetical protein